MIGAEIGTIRQVRIAGPGREFLIDDEPVDIIIGHGRIVDIAPTGALRPVGEVLDAGGAWAVP
ncbi:MAG TPA: metal-dependent hydrolase, partial [Microbacterium sp.]|nr:metal-dependent hydrolase [Microbacterium sp.]